MKKVVLLALLAVAGCAADRDVCYETVPHYEYGNQLKVVPCPEPAQE